MLTILSAQSTSWPITSFWYELDDEEDIWDAIITYLVPIEDEVNDQLGVEIETSGQGDIWEVIIVDINDGSTYEIEGFEWESHELDMAHLSQTPADYKKRYMDYITSILSGESDTSMM